MLSPPHDTFWDRRVGSCGAALVAASAVELRRLEAARVNVAEVAARERIVRVERAERLAQVRQVLNQLHLDRTNWRHPPTSVAAPLTAITMEERLAFYPPRGGSPDGERGPVTWVMHTALRASVASVVETEEVERCVIEEHEWESRARVRAWVVPLLQRVVLALRSARANLAHGEMQRREAVMREEEVGWERLLLESQMLGHTARVLMQFAQENDRTGDIGRRLEESGWRSLQGGKASTARHPNLPEAIEAPEVSRFTHDGRPERPSERGWRGDDSEVELLFRPLTDSGPGQEPSGGYYYSSARRQRKEESITGSPQWQRVRKLQEDTEILEGHVVGLQALREAETDRLVSIREQVAMLDNTLRERRRQLAEIETYVTRRGSPRRDAT